MRSRDGGLAGQQGQTSHRAYKGDFKMIWQILQDAEHFYARHGTVNLQIAAALRALDRLHASAAAP